MTTQYTALTIGPIYKTLSQARKTRELWGGSYLFSYIMRRIMEELIDISKCCLPYHENILAEGKGKGAGLFPDRLIYEGDIIENVMNAETTILNEIAVSTGMPLDYLNNYIRIYALTFTLPTEVSTSDKKDKRQAENNNIVIVANKLLDTEELKEKHFTGDIDKIDWRKAIDKINGDKFYKEAFVGKDKQFKFPSILEIATDDFRKKNKSKYYELVKQYLNNKDEKSEEEDRNDQEKFIEALRADSREQGKNIFKPVSFRPYHKYIAVVQADGDNIGKTIEKIGDNPDTVRQFSSALFEFAIAAQKAVKNYGGKAVYVGGDDLLFFAPVAVYNEGENGPALKSIFGLIEDIDKIFEQKIIQAPNLKALYENGGALADKKPSMSYGVSITYSKYPLNEARDSAYELLNEVKQIKAPEKKNRINFKLHKHSGQGFGFMVNKNEWSGDGNNPKSFDLFVGMLGNIPLQEGLVSSIIYKLGPLHKLLNEVTKLPDIECEERLKDFFDQEFELDKLRKMQRDGNIKPEETARLNFLDTIVKFYNQLAVDFPNDNKPLPERETEKSDSNVAKLYSTLRFMKHLIDEDDERN